MPNTAKSQKTPCKQRHARDQNYQEILAEAAHYNAEQHGFMPGFEDEEWQETENKIVAMLKLH